MTSSPGAISGLLNDFSPFDRLPPARRDAIDPLLEPLRFRIGQTVLRPDVLPEGLLLLCSGQLRSLGPSPNGRGLRTIERLGPGSLAGWAGLLRGDPCEHLRATTDVEALQLPAAAFRDLLGGHPDFAAWFANRPSAAELHTLLLALAKRDPLGEALLDDWPLPADQVRVRSLRPGGPTELGLPPGFRWYASSGLPLAEPWSDRPLAAPGPEAPWLRLVGLAIPHEAEAPITLGADPLPPTLLPSVEGAAASYAPPVEPPPRRAADRSGQLVLGRASGPRAVPIALCQALADYFGVPLNRDALADQVDAILQRQDRLNLVNIGQIMDTLGLRVVLSRVPASRLGRVPAPALLHQNGHFGLLDGVEADGRARLLEAELGALLVPAEELVTHEGGLVELLLFDRKPDAKQRRFDWSWYAPFLRQHRRELIEVLVASVVINALRLVFPLGLMVLIQSVVASRNIGALVSIASVMLLAALVESIFKTLRSFLFTDLANRIDLDAKATILDHLVRLPQGFFDSRPVGRITFYFSQLDRLRDFLLGQTLPTLVDFAFSLIYIAILFAISPLLTLVTLATLPLIAAVGLVSNPLVRSQINRTMAQAVRASSFLTEAITGIQTIKSQNAELKTRWEFQNRYAAYIGEDFKLKVTRESIANLSNFLSNLGQLVVIAVAIWLIIKGDLSLAALFGFNILSGYIRQPLVQLVGTWQDFQFNTQALRMVADVVDRDTEQTREQASNIPLPPLQGRVQFVDVGFRFSDQGPLVLDGVDLEIPAGSFVGLVGGSGSGKSTLLKLLSRFYAPERGSVLIDGLDIGKVELYSLRRQIGVVPQDSLLFDGTIRENLLMVKPDATAAEMIRAARIACAHDFIMQMPQGYNSSVGERGAGLSGGQRQRLALARAVLQNPRLLILDEATSALDATTERQVCINLFEAFRGRTVFFITHRLSTVQPADLIVLMDKGAVMEKGSHRQLMQLRGWYYALYRSQNQEGLS
ncbi:ATP-binding cassette domain-containing protein [Cyanobium sp. N.Huapi 1H5]|uniref:ABC transporter transmembrane domain-containing protein n=1 Tax=Cyanobium sp. N.Huapi 1H5 TaxID=2823719 RepID=UPI0021BCC8BC|nr:ABC transporter transmembrane domain-containing protein [Cyanobium sp. N.Huapi 1H5]MCP9838866.1 ATP-binding cassette domain-containing protein [Cyanobium sp. N.Huapi 1H5]